MNFRLKVWRQKSPKAKGKLVQYEAADVSPNTSFLEMLDVVNEGLVARGEEPIAFDSDCREGICGTCSLTINGEAHGPDHPGAACEVYMRRPLWEVGRRRAFVNRPVEQSSAQGAKSRCPVSDAPAD